MLPEFWWGQSDWRILKIFHITHMISTYFTENKNILRSCRQIVLTAQNRFLQITDIVVQRYSHVNCIPCDICYDEIFLNSFMPWKPVYSVRTFPSLANIEKYSWLFIQNFILQMLGSSWGWLSGECPRRSPVSSTGRWGASSLKGRKSMSVCSGEWLSCTTHRVSPF